MAQLLVELQESVNTEIELNEATNEKNYYIKGVFMESEQGNRNGRIYPKHLMEREIATYIRESINTNKMSSMGELHHPANRVSVDPDRAAIRIQELRMEGNDVIGKAKVLTKFPCGLTVKNLIDEGIQFGVSSRALGSLKKLPSGLNEVQSDFSLKTIDVVSDPSAHKAWVQALTEGKEWTFIDGIWTEQNIEESKSLIRKASSKELNEVMLSQFNLFIKSL